jgi:hypothetical protein
MALDLRVAVNKAVVDLQREISKKTSDLVSPDWLLRIPCTF